MRKTIIIATTAAALAVPAVPSVAAAATQYEGTVVSVDRSARTFRLDDSQRATIRIRVTSATRWERIGGFSGLSQGMNRVEATVRRSGGRWIATLVQRSGGGGKHGGKGSDD